MKTIKVLLEERKNKYACIIETEDDIDVFSTIEDKCSFNFCKSLDQAKIKTIARLFNFLDAHNLGGKNIPEEEYPVIMCSFRIPEVFENLASYNLSEKFTKYLRFKYETKRILFKKTVDEQQFMLLRKQLNTVFANFHQYYDWVPQPKQNSTSDKVLTNREID
ncbi:MAG: hypothetical protein QXL94_04035 [Candidatus Parvarchaeum sp.]